MERRSVDSAIERIIREGRRRLTAGEAQMLQQVLGAYERAHRTLMMDIAVLEEQIRRSIEAADGPVTEAWIRRQGWFKVLDASITRETARLESEVRQLVAASHQVAAGEVVTVTRSMIAYAPWLREVDVPAIERWIASIQPGSPLDRVLRSYGSDANAVMRDRITQGIIRGRGTGNVTREIMAILDEQMEEYKAARIVRNEMLRTYRGVWRDQMESLPSDMVVGFRRVATLDARTCPVCVAKHNRITEHYPDDFHVLCRCDVVPVFGADYVPAPEGGYQTGEEWLREQPEEMQRRILGGGERYELWKSGLTLPGMVEYRPDPVWGGTSNLIPLERLRKAA